MSVTKKTHKRESNLGDLFKKAVSLHKKKCIFPGCVLFASFGYRNKRKLYCTTHKPNDKKLIRSGILCRGGCGKQANYGPPESKLKTHCITCKPDNYISKKKICSFEGCVHIVAKKNLCHKHYHSSNTPTTTNVSP